jgi:hypothetical protein
MKLTTLGTILASVLLSVIATNLFIPRPVEGNSEVIRAKTIELTDAKGNVRVKITAKNTNGDENPEIVMLGADGQPSVLLTTNKKGEGTLYFSTREKEGRVALGYVWGSDVPEKNGYDPLAFWGMRVLGQHGQSEALGIGVDGRSIVAGK